MDRMRWLEAQAEQAYCAMYEARPGSDLAARYSDAKEFLHDAIGLAHRLGQAEEAERLAQRLAEIKTDRLPPAVSCLAQAREPFQHAALSML